MRLFDVFLNLLIDGREVGKRQFRVDDFDVFEGVHVTGNVNHIFVVEATDDVRNGIALTARSVKLTDEEKAVIRPLFLLTMKPVMYVANVDDHGFENNPLLDKVKAFAAEENAPVVAVCAKTEADIADLDDADKEMFLEDMGMTEPGLDRVIRAGYELLGLQTYFTAGVKEVRAWTIHKGDTAPKAAGVKFLR